MVIGNGLIAQAFRNYQDDDEKLLFASGVSNSVNRAESAFTRERDLLAKNLSESAGKTFIYFGTCGVYDPRLSHSPYVQHKLAMEKLIRNGHSNYHIFRISNLAGKTDNPHTVLNFFFQHIRSGESFHLWKKASRNIIDVSDAYKICDHIVKNKLYPNGTVTVANPLNYPVAVIISEIEKFTGKKGNYDVINKESNPEIDISDIREIIAELNIGFNPDYLQKTIQKYYTQDVS